MLERSCYPNFTERNYLELNGIDLNLLEELNFFQNLNSCAFFHDNPAIIELLNHKKFEYVKKIIFPSKNNDLLH